MKRLLIPALTALALIGVLLLARYLSQGAQAAPLSVKGANENSGSNATEPVPPGAHSSSPAMQSRSELPGTHPERENGASKKRRRGEFRLMTRQQFLDRLHELGVDGGGSLFDRIHKQRSDLGAVLVLVTNEENEAVAAARVYLDPSNSESLRAHVGTGSYSSDVRTGSSQATGVALFSNVSPKPHLLGVEHNEYLTRYFGSIDVPQGETTYVEAVLEGASARITGLVTNAAAVPVEGATVSASHFIEGGIPFTATDVTGFDGEFSLGVVTGSQNMVSAGKLGFEETSLQHIAAGTNDLRIVLEEARTVSIKGFVTRGTSLEPIVEFTVDSEFHHDAGGVFRVERNVGEDPIALLFAAEGFDARTISVSLAAGDDVDLGQVSLFGEGELNGIVLLEQEEGDPTPVAGATVSISSESGAPQSDTTTADGLFAFRGLAAESVRLEISAQGAAHYENQIELIDEGPTFVEVLLTRGEYSVRGIVVDDETEEPIEGARIELVERPDLGALSDANGSYEITGIPLDQFTLEASDSGYKNEVSPALSGSEDDATWDVRLKPSGLRIRFQLSGQPAPTGTPVTLWTRIEPNLSAALAAQQSIGSMRYDEVTDDDGQVTFDVEDGDYFVQVASYRLHPTLVQADEEQADWITIPLPGVTNLQGRIQNSDGSPVANTSIWLHSGDQGYSTMSLYHTDGAGNYNIPSIAPRSYALSIIKSVADQSAQHVRGFFGSGGSSQTFNVSFPPLTASVHGRLTDGEGAGKGGVWIGVEYLDGQQRSILAGWVGTDSSGFFDVPRLEPGRHILRTAWSNDATVFSEEFVLAPGENLELDIVAPRVPGQHVHGHMIASDGGPLGGNFVFATDGAGRKNGNYFSTMDWAYVGAFDVGSLAPGSYRLDLTAMGCVANSVQVAAFGTVTGLVVSMDREN